MKPTARVGRFSFIFVLILTIALAASVLAGCSGGATPASGVTTGPTQSIHIVTSTHAASTPLASTTAEVAIPMLEGYPAPTEAVPVEGYPAPMETPVTDEYPAPAETITENTALTPFDGARAYQDVITQLEFGPRLPGSDAHTRAVDWMKAELENSGWMVEIQETTYEGQPVRNVIAKRGTGQPWIILGAHYDSRFKADNDPDISRHEDPVPGANDGASGVAVLLELARVLPTELDKEVWLVMFDSEDQGRLPGWDWIIGSRAFVESLETDPQAAVIVDMIGDANLNIPYEQNSDQAILQDIWAVAAQRGHGDVFLPEPGPSMLDDHTPFLEKGIRAADIIDFAYPYWHTVSDTADKVSPDSLFAVGDTLLYWLTGPLSSLNP